MVTKVFNKLNGKIEVNQAEIDAEHLSIKAIKLKLNCLFNSRNKKQKWNWNEKINNKHIIRNWLKTQTWREKWNKIAISTTNKDIYEVLLCSYKKQNFDKMAKLVNDATEDLTYEYLIYSYQNYIKL